MRVTYEVSKTYQTNQKGVHLHEVLLAIFNVFMGPSADVVILKIMKLVSIHSGSPPQKLTFSDYSPDLPDNPKTNLTF